MKVAPRQEGKMPTRRIAQERFYCDPAQRKPV
jgi:hypothetical protein